MFIYRCSQVSFQSVRSIKQHKFITIRYHSPPFSSTFSNTSMSFWDVGFSMLSAWTCLIMALHVYYNMMCCRYVMCFCRCVGCFRFYVVYFCRYVGTFAIMWCGLPAKTRNKNKIISSK